MSELPVIEPGVCMDCGGPTPGQHFRRCRECHRARCQARDAAADLATPAPAVVVVVSAAAGYVLTCIDCGATIPVHRSDRATVPLCARDRDRRQAAKAAKLRARRGSRELRRGSR